MNRSINCKFIVVLLLFVALLASCARVQSVTVPPETIQKDAVKEKHIQANKMVLLALQYHDQEGFEKCSDLFLEAAEIYRTGLIDTSRKAYLAAAKCQMKAGDKDGFLLTMGRYRTFLPPLQMPSEDERFLIDLADSMNNKPLTYPVLQKWGNILR